MLGSMPMFAVGNPSRLPTRSPASTGPDMEYSRPSRRFASSISPVVMRRRTSELCSSRPSILNGGMTSTACPWPRSQSALPVRPRPNAKSKPITQRWMSIAAARRSMNSCGDSAASSRSKRSTIACSMPAFSISASFSCSVVIDCGQLAGSRTQRGCGSKVMSAGAAFSSAAARTACSITSRWPRCTPSKLPTVNATRPIGLVGSPKWTFSSAPSPARRSAVGDRCGRAR